VKAVRLSWVILAGFLILIVNLFRMQILQGDFYRVLSEKNRIRVVYLEGPRGNILDRNSQPLATSRLSFNLAVIPDEAKSKIKESCQAVGRILGEYPEVLERRFYKRKFGNFNTILLAEDIRRDQAVALEERLDSLPGFQIETRPQREYRLGEAAAHLAGFIGPMEEEEEERLAPYGYTQRDWIGRDGIEKVCESALRGSSGGLQIEVNSRGRLVRALGVKEPKEGKDVRLTVDARLQCYIQGLLRSQKGAVIVMELKEGGILSINSSPSFDSNLFASAKGRKGVDKYLHDPQAPMVNRGVRGQYPPGSIFKIITALAALEKGKISPTRSFNCAGLSIIGGNKFHCWNKDGHGPQSLTQGFAHSCNVYFYSVGLLAGADALFEKSLEFGFNQPTGVDLPGEKRGFVPSREWKRRTKKEFWYDGETANFSIGQGYLQVTPIQALGMISAIATRGEILRPHLIDKIDGEKAEARQVRFIPITPSYLNAVREGLDQVINSETGTGRLARQENVRVAGKTGTAQSGQHKTHAWFVGFAPEESPKIALVVFLEHGGRGGVAAASMAGAVFHWLKEASYL